MGLGKPPAPTAETARGPKQAAHAGPGRPLICGYFTLPGSTAAYRGRQVTGGKTKPCNKLYRASRAPLDWNEGAEECGSIAIEDRGPIQCGCICW